MTMKRKTFTAIILLLGFSNFVLAEVLIQGRLLNENKQAISQAEVSLAGAKVSTDNQGFYQIKAPDADIYQLNFAKSCFYSSVQTFSHFELTNNEQPWQFADITLVTKAKGRVMLAFGGDAMMGRRYYKPYFGDSVLIDDNSRLADSRAIVENVNPYMSLADIASVNLETQVFNVVPGDAAPKSVH